MHDHANSRLASSILAKQDRRIWFQPWSAMGPTHQALAKGSQAWTYDGYRRLHHQHADQALTQMIVGDGGLIRYPRTCSTDQPYRRPAAANAIPGHSSTNRTARAREALPGAQDETFFCLA